MALLVGLTGGMGAGKSTVGKIFEDLGAHVIDADVLSRALVEPGQPAWREVIDLLGNGILRDDHTLDRGKIADIVFNNPGQKRALEAIIHPKVIREEQSIFNDIIKKEPDALVLVDAALLIESGNYRKMDKVVVVTCAEETRIQRILANRNFSRDDVLRRAQGQMPQEEKMKFADYVIQNDSGLVELRAQVEKLFYQLKREIKRTDG